MSCSLHLDTSNRVILGVLDEQFTWLEYLLLDERKSSAIVHREIYNILQRLDLSIDDVNDLFFCAGPGSYTGIRVSSGIGQIFELADKKVYSYWHQEVPSLLGMEKGTWVSDAFKQELFVYNWDKEKSQQNLVPKDEFQDPHALSFQDTEGLIKKNSSRFFSSLKASDFSRKDNFYYRTIESEFKVKK